MTNYTSRLPDDNPNKCDGWQPAWCTSYGSAAVSRLDRTPKHKDLPKSVTLRERPRGSGRIVGRPAGKPPTRRRRPTDLFKCNGHEPPYVEVRISQRRLQRCRDCEPRGPEIARKSMANVQMRTFSALNSRLCVGTLLVHGGLVGNKLAQR